MYPQTCNANIYEVVDNVFQYHLIMLQPATKSSSQYFMIFHKKSILINNIKDHLQPKKDPYFYYET